jgi:hypothetical protein
MAKFASDAARGAQEQTRAMEQLNINSAAFIKLPMDQQFSTIIDKLGQVENVTLRNALGQEALGKGYSELAGLVSEGAEQFAKATRDAQAWGLAINRVDAAKIEMANDAMTRARDAAKGLFTTIALTVSPVIKAMGDFFADSAAEAGGFKKQAGEAAEVVITGIGYAANVVQGLRFAYVALKLAVAEFFDMAVRSFAFFAEKGQFLGNIFKNMPGPMGIMGHALRLLSVTGRVQLSLLAESTGATAARIKEELDSIALEGLPKDKIIAKVREIRELMQKEAEEIAKRRQQMMLGGGEDIERDKAVEKKEPKDTFRDRLAQQIERLREENLTELQLLDEKLREKNILLQTALEAGLINEEFGLAQSALLRQKREDQELQHQARLGDIHAQGVLARRQFEQMNMTQQAAFVFQTIGGITAASAQQNRTMFNLNKAAGIGQAIVNSYVGYTKALAQGGIFGFVTGALVLAAGLLQVAQIKKQQFGQGGTSAPSIGGGLALPVTPAIDASVSTAPPQVTAQASEDRTMNVTILGRSSDKVSYAEMVEDLIPVLEQAVANGATRLNVGFAS